MDSLNVDGRSGLRNSANRCPVDGMLVAEPDGDDMTGAVGDVCWCQGRYTPSGDSTRIFSSRISPRSSAVLNSAAISLALRRPLGRSQR